MIAKQAFSIGLDEYVTKGSQRYSATWPHTRYQVI